MLARWRSAQLILPFTVHRWFTAGQLEGAVTG